MISTEEIEAYSRYGDGIKRRVETKVDVSSIRAVMGKLRQAAIDIERHDHDPERSNRLHTVWKAMSFLEDSFSQGFWRLVKED